MIQTDEAFMVNRRKHTHTYTHRDRHENIILMGDFKIDFKNKEAGFDKLGGMYGTFNLTNLIKSETCYIENYKSLIELFFTNKPWSFQKTHVTKIGLIDYHRLNSTFPISKSQAKGYKNTETTRTLIKIIS